MNISHRHQYWTLGENQIKKRTKDLNFDCVFYPKLFLDENGFEIMAIIIAF